VNERPTAQFRAYTPTGAIFFLFDPRPDIMAPNHITDASSSPVAAFTFRRADHQVFDGHFIVYQRVGRVPSS